MVCLGAYVVNLVTNGGGGSCSPRGTPHSLRPRSPMVHSFRNCPQRRTGRLSQTVVLSLKLRMHLVNVWPNKSKRVWANARRAFATAVCAFPLASTCDKDMPIAYTFVHHLSEISFDARSSTTYSANTAEWQTNMTKCVLSCLLQSPHLANACVRLCLAKHICQVYTRLKSSRSIANPVMRHALQIF